MKTLLILASLLLTNSVFSQDERTYRSLFMGDLNTEDQEVETPKYKWKTHSPFYHLDLTGDKLDESFGIEKRDGEDWITFLDILKRPVKSFKLEATGADAFVYKVRFVRIGPRTKVMIVFYFEGKNQTTEFRSSSRLYFITIDDNKLNTLSIFKGPYVFNEAEEVPEHYHVRNFKLYIDDLNHDGIKEIIVRHHLINRVYSYLGNGKWK